MYYMTCYDLTIHVNLPYSTTPDSALRALIALCFLSFLVLLPSLHFFGLRDGRQAFFQSYSCGQPSQRAVVPSEYTIASTDEWGKSAWDVKCPHPTAFSQ